MTNTLAHRFGGSTLDTLAAAAGPRASAAQHIPLAAIEEDPDQPRRNFDVGALASLAESIRFVGVLQPVGVRLIGPSRYRLTWGARRLRAAALVGLQTIPAVLAGAEQQSYAAQVIENQQRAALSTRELAAAVEQMTQDGMSNATIASALAVSDQALKHYRAVGDLPPEMEPWLDVAPVRALYEVLLAWRKGDAEAVAIRAALAAHEGELSMTDARRIIAGATGRSAGTFDVAPVTVARPPIERGGKREKVTAVDVDAERVAQVRAWLDHPARPRPALTV